MCPRKRGEKDGVEVKKKMAKEDYLKLRILFLTKTENRFSNQFPPVLGNKKK